MKITQIVAESRVDEAPVSGIRQGLRKFGAKALAKVGAKDAAMGIAGAVDTGDEANALRTEFQNYIGQTGQKTSQIDAQDLANWLKTKKMPTNSVPPSGTVSKKMLDQILLKAVQDSKKAGGVPSAQPAAGADAGASPQATQGAGQPDNAKQGTTDTGAVDKATATGSSGDGAGKAPPTGNGSAVGKSETIPPNIQAQLDLLNGPDKKRLASML